MKAWLIGGPYDNIRTELSAAPPIILVGKTWYKRIDDPDTGDYLGGYVWKGSEHDDDRPSPGDLARGHHP